MRPAALLLAVLLLGACSPAYVYRSAAGHAGLLWRRRSIEASLADPGTAPELKAKLALALEIRRFAFERLFMSPSKDYRHWTPVEGGALTWLVSASRRTRLERVLFRFPLIGSFPYKGHFRKELAAREAEELERRGLDASVSGSSAYNTPLPVSDPLPSSVLRWEAGDLAELLIHELAHGTVSVKSQGEFNEAFASWAGERGAEAFLRERFGADSKELKSWLEGRERGRRKDALGRELRERLERLYAGPGSDEDKLARRQAEFDWARARARELGVPPFREPLNNAVVLAYSLYAPDPAPFDALFEREGRDWGRAYAALRALDRKDPMKALRAAAQK